MTMGHAERPRRDMDELEQCFRLGIAEDLDRLALLHDREPDAAMLAELKEAGFPGSFALRRDSYEALDAADLLACELAALTAAGQAGLEEAAAAYADVYLTHGLGISPSESPWIDSDGLERQGPMLAVRRWYGQHRLKVADWRLRPDDHLVNQLRFLAHLLRNGSGDATLDEAARFLADHTLRWVPHFAARLAARRGPPLYVALALLTALYLEDLHRILRSLVPSFTPPPAPAPCAGGCGSGAL